MSLDKLLAHLTTALQPKPELVNLECGRQVLIGPDGSVTDLEPMRLVPIASPRFTNVADFCEYIKRFGGPESVIFLNPDGEGATAILDYFPADVSEEPTLVDGFGQCLHRAVLDLTKTATASIWIRHSSSWMAQASFADFLHENRSHIVEPSGADLVAVIKALKLVATAEYQDVRDDLTGSIELTYNRQVEARQGGGKAKTTIELPRAFTVRTLVHEGDLRPVDLVCELRYRPPRDGDHYVAMSYRIDQLADMMRAACEAMRERISEETERPIYMGSPR